MNASNRAEGGTSAFSWVAHLSSRLVVMVTTSRYFFRHHLVTPFFEGVMRRTKRGWDPSFFCRFVMSALAFAFGAVMLSTDLLPWFDALTLFVGGIPCRLFIACGRPTQERSSLPVLTVLPLLAGKHLVEGGWVEKTRVQTSGSGRHPEVFFCGPKKFRECVGGSVGGNPARFQENVHNSSRKFGLDLKSANSLSV